MCNWNSTKEEKVEKKLSEEINVLQNLCSSQIHETLYTPNTKTIHKWIQKRQMTKL